MTRLIDADALRTSLGITGTAESCKGCQYNELWDFACNTDKAPNFAYVCEQIDNAPTIDAVPVIRCRDCKHYYVLNEVRGNCSEYNFVEKIPIDYCSWAERKEE